jgi:16S rRNA (guanine527-N7)-methyltransferase
MITDEASARAFIAERWGTIALERLDRFAELLVEENRVQNLIAAASIPCLFQRHLADSAQLCGLVPRETNGVWLDLGSGAGLPGLVVGALEPTRSVVLVESRTKRIAWLNRAASALDLSNVEVLGSRLEAVADRKAAVISARAFAPLAKTLDLAARFSTSETLWLLPKGRSAQQELRSVGIRGRLFHVEQSLTDPEAGIIVGHQEQQRGRNS